ncbi:MAG: hypothetical protein V3U71_02380 [Cocleimonas sp.]
MNSEHESFLKPFFNRMNESFLGQWCVLHSYETLPYFSESDVDMAFSASNVFRLEQLIIDVGKQHGWSLYQKLWYDVEKCFYYVLKNDSNDRELAIDFLIDNNGIGKYGFKTSLLTDQCSRFNEIIPIPNSSIAFSYKFIKRIVKKRALEQDKTYLIEHFKKADYSVIKTIMLQQFGVAGLKIIDAQISGNNFNNISNQTMDDLMLLRKKQFIKRNYWEARRVLYRVFNPCGMIINIPQLPTQQLAEFIILLDRKVGLLFRFVISNSSNKLSIDYKALFGSTLVIKTPKTLSSNKAIKHQWFGSHRYQEVNLKDSFDIEYLVKTYYEKILLVLKERSNSRGLISYEK